MRLRKVVGTLVFLWLLIGVVAVWQRGYLSNTGANCKSAGTIALTVIAGPLNYGGFNPKVSNCHLPTPSAMRDNGIEHLIGME